MRLIDADKFISFIDAGKYCNPNALTFSENDLCEMIDNQPTAYDIDNVCEELDRAEYQHKLFDEDNCEIIESLLKADMVESIVRQGGINAVW